MEAFTCSDGTKLDLDAPGFDATDAVNTLLGAGTTGIAYQQQAVASSVYGEFIASDAQILILRRSLS
jgi:hypothetical protein